MNDIDRCWIPVSAPCRSEGILISTTMHRREFGWPFTACTGHMDILSQLQNVIRLNLSSGLPQEEHMFFVRNHAPSSLNAHVQQWPLQASASPSCWTSLFLPLILHGSCFSTSMPVVGMAVSGGCSLPRQQAQLLQIHPRGSTHLLSDCSGAR